MTIVVEQSTTQDDRPLPPVFTGAARWAAAVLVTVGAALQVVEFLLEPAAPNIAARVDWWMEHPDRLSWSQAAGTLAIPFLIGAFAVMVRIARPTSRRVATGAAVALTAAMSGLAAIHGVEMAANWLARTGDTQAAISVLEASDVGVSGAVMLVLFLGGALSGTVLVNVALWRSPYVPRLVVLFGVGFIVLDLVLAMSVSGHLSALAAGAVLAWAILTDYRRAPRRSQRMGSFARRQG